jgi:hypothetical protein
MVTPSVRMQYRSQSADGGVEFSQTALAPRKVVIQQREESWYYSRYMGVRVEAFKRGLRRLTLRRPVVLAAP